LQAYLLKCRPGGCAEAGQAATEEGIMKTVKISIAALCLGAALFLATSAQAYAIYNHSDHTACITKWYNLFNCHVKVAKHSDHNGPHGAGLNGVNVVWSTNNNMCYSTDQGFDIPKGGYIRIYNHEVKIYDHHDNHKKTIGISGVECKRLM
jgi:hypothetical protein